MSPLEFRGEVNREQTIESWGYPPMKTQTVRRTESIIANTALCIASYVDAL